MSKIISTIYIYILKPSVLLFVRNQVISNCIDANWHFILYRWKNGDPSSVTLFYWNIIWKNSIRVNERHFSSEVLYNWIMECDRTFIPLHHYFSTCTVMLVGPLFSNSGKNSVFFSGTLEDERERRSKKAHCIQPPPAPITIVTAITKLTLWCWCCCCRHPLPVTRTLFQILWAP